MRMMVRLKNSQKDVHNVHTFTDSGPGDWVWRKPRDHYGAYKTLRSMVTIVT